MGEEGGKKLTTKECKGTIWGGGDMRYFDCDGGYTIEFVNSHRTGRINMLNFTV